MRLTLFISCFLLSASHGLNAMVRHTTPPTNQAVLKTSFSFPLYDRDFFTTGKTHDDILKDRLTRDQHRVDYLFSVQEDGNPSLVTSVYPSDYLAIFEVGSGANRQRVALLIDPACPMVWWQCNSTNCLPRQTFYPIYNPTQSQSFSPIYCRWWRSRSCKCLVGSFISSCHNPDDYCRFSIAFGNGLSAFGVLSSEALYFEFNPTRKVEILFGCAQNAVGQFPNQASGIVGLKGHYSLTTQLNASVFSFCSPGRMPNNQSSTLDFNIPYELGSFPMSVTTKLLDPPPRLHPDYYYIGIKQVVVGRSSVVDVPPSFWGFENNGKGVIIDIGTTISRLPREAYSKFRDEFLSIMEKQVPELKHFPYFEPHECFIFRDKEVPLRSLNVPSIYFNLIDGGTLEIEFPDQLLMKVYDFYCLNFLPEDKGMTILGSTLFETMRLIFDLSQNTVTFKRHGCA